MILSAFLVLLCRNFRESEQRIKRKKIFIHYVYSTPKRAIETWKRTENKSLQSPKPVRSKLPVSSGGILPEIEVSQRQHYCKTLCRDGQKSYQSHILEINYQHINHHILRTRRATFYQLQRLQPSCASGARQSRAEKEGPSHRIVCQAEIETVE